VRSVLQREGDARVVLEALPAAAVDVLGPDRHLGPALVDGDRTDPALGVEPGDCSVEDSAPLSKM
jgi:hypothetical protein